MNNVYEDIRGMIGNTPILKINHMGVKPGVNIYAKLELMNPAGSVKDRIGVYMIDDAKKRGVLKEGGTIIDATAGNTGIGIAVAALNPHCGEFGLCGREEVDVIAPTVEKVVKETGWNVSASAFR